MELVQMIRVKFVILITAIMVAPATAMLVGGQQEAIPFPTIDGVRSTNEWPSKYVNTYEFGNNKQVSLAYRFNGTHLIFMAQYTDETPSTFGTVQDAFAIGFDNNGDQANMGSTSSPDDSVFIGLYGNYSLDVYMRGIGQTVLLDTDVGGVNDTEGRFSISQENLYTFETAKPINSGDINGEDISLGAGDTINIMLAYWDDLPPMTEVSGFTEWIKLKIVDPPSQTNGFSDLFVPAVVLVTFVVIVVGIRVLYQKKKAED